jgi:hypothetical protein
MKQRVATKLVGKTNRELPCGVCLLVRRDSQALAFRLTGPFPIRIPPYPGCSRSAGIRIDGMPAGRMPSSAAFIRDQVLMTANVDGGQKYNWQRKL